MATTTVSIPEYKTCKSKDVIDFCKAKGEVGWLKAANEESKNFFQLKKAFYTKFAPELIPTRKKGYKDDIANL